jgi:hypothetical protein
MTGILLNITYIGLLQNPCIYTYEQIFALRACILSVNIFCAHVMLDHQVYHYKKIINEKYPINTCSVPRPC